MAQFLEESQKKTDWIGLRNQALFMLLYGAGLRISEALSLDCKHMDTHDAIKVLGKGKKERMVPLLPVVKQAIQRYLSALPKPLTGDCPLFLGAKGGRLHMSVAEKQVRDLRRSLNLPETVTPHALRHSFATHLLEGKGICVQFKSFWAMYLSRQRRYTHANRQHLKEVYQAAHPRAHKPSSSKEDV